jgi:hypothetical protein
MTAATLPDVQDWVDRLRAAAPSLLHVGDSIDLAQALVTLQFESPSAYVVLAGERPNPNPSVNGVAQETGIDVAVVFLVHNFRADDPDPGGDAGLRLARASALGALLNWAPADADPVEYAGGTRIAGIDANVLIWQDDYTTRYLLRSV